MRIRIRHIAVIWMALGSSACANFSAGNLFSHYSEQNRKMYRAVKQGDYQKASEELPDGIGGKILDNMEKGRVYFLNKDVPESQSFLEQSDQAVRRQQDQAIISISREASSAGSLLANDNLREYVPADYELGFLHLYLALSYVYKNQLEDALVELRRANQVQEKARNQREDELLKERDRLKQEGIQPNLGGLMARYPSTGSTLQSIQNGYLFYLSGLLYEASGDLNDAYVDYRRALAVAPENTSVAQSTLRCAQKLGMDQDLVSLRKKYGHLQRLGQNQGRIIIIQEQGIVDQLKGWQLSLPIYDSLGRMNLYSLALPYYSAYQPSDALPVMLDGVTVAGQRLVDTNLMARKQLNERIKSIVFRQILRLTLKNALRKETAKDDNNGAEVANLVLNVWNTLTEQPDTRSWITLPGTVFSATKIVSAGEQTLSVGQQSYTFNVPAQGTTFVWLSRQGENAVIWHKQLGRL
ncbi:COG3014 family protein [Vibrio ruber]|uniref:COG3014 family protein n=1 Tax=Vibrio ruber TaxID=184755 RepID=UPI0035D89065